MDQSSLENEKGVATIDQQRVSSAPIYRDIDAANDYTGLIIKGVGNMMQMPEMNTSANHTNDTKQI